VKKIAIILSLIVTVSGTQLKVPSAYSTIQAGLNAASSGDTVLVAVGTYTENIIWPDVNGIKLISAGDSSNTIIDGNQAGSVIKISYNQIDSTTVISGFTITGGGNTNRGGGMDLIGSPKITKSNINYNSANSEGGGLHLQGSSPLIIDVTIYGNVQNDNGGTVNNGGGICMSDGSSPLLKNVIISKNSSQNAGGMFISYDSNPTLENVIISHNTNEGIYLWSSSLIIKNVKIAHNGGYGIRMIRESTLSKVENLVIENNNSAGIYIAQTTPITISDVSLLNNIYPFQIIGGSSVSFENNTIFSNFNPNWIYLQDNKSTIKLSNLIENGKMIAGSGVAFQAINNYWGHSSGPFNSETNPMGQGDTIDNNIVASPWLSSPNLDAPPIPANQLILLKKDRQNGEISMQWNYSKMNDFAGYIVHYGNIKEYPLTNSIDNQMDTTFTINLYYGSDSIHFAVSTYDLDGNHSGNSRYLLITNEAPVIAAARDITFAEDTTGSLVLSATDIDGDGITYSAKSSSDDVATTVSKDTLTLTPAANWNGTSTITAYASDGTLKDSTTFTLKVAAVNDTPVITAVADDSTNEESEKSIVVSASDVEGDVLTYTASSDTSAVALTFSSDTLKLTPATNYTGIAKITVVVSDNALTDTTSFNFNVININDSPVISTLSDVTIKEDETTTVALSATDAEGDAITYSAVSDTNAVTISVPSTILTLTPNANWHGVANIKAYASDGSAKDSTSFKLTVNPVSDIAAVQDVTIDEDKSAEVTLTSTFTGTTTFTAVSDTNAVTTSVSSSTLTLTPNANWHGVATIKVYASDGSSKDSTSFKLTVTPVNDAPTAFEWVSSALDTINITKSNLDDNYNLQWGTSTDAADGDTIDYLVYAKIGINPPEEIYDTTSTSVPITYEEFLENVFEPFPMLPRVTVKFTIVATDGIDTVKVTGDDRVVFVNRYEYLSTESEGIPTVFALHENYPNPFNPTTTLRFDLPEVSDITLTIYNMLGQKVRTFNYQNTSAGYHSIKWNATNDLGDPVGAGVYLYQLQTKDFVKTRKMVLLK